MIRSFLAAVLSLTIFTADITESSAEKTGAMSVDYNVAGSYTVTIPASVTFTKSGETVERGLSAKNVTLSEGSKLQVHVSSLNGFKLKNLDSYIDYTITANKVSDIQEDSVILSVSAGDTSGWTLLDFTAQSTDNAAYAGEYSDTLTFTVEVV